MKSYYDKLDNKIDYFKSGNTIYFYEINNYISDFKYENSIILNYILVIHFS